MAVIPVSADLVVRLALEACRFRSPAGEEGPLAAVLMRELDRLGFETELQEVVAGRPNVVAISRGSSEFQSVMLNGHLDMPMPVGEWQRDPFDPWIEGGLLYGAAVCDMKGALASLIAGAARASDTPRERRGDVIVTIVMHHDGTGLGTKYFLENSAWRIDWGINGEPTDLAAQLFHGGSWGFELSVEGVPRHQVRLEEGVNSITIVSAIINRLNVDCLTYDKDTEHAELPRLVVGYIEGGDSSEISFTAEHCLARGNVRFLPSMSVDGMKADIRRVVNEVCAGSGARSTNVRTLALEWPFHVDLNTSVMRALSDAHSAVTGHRIRTISGLPMSASVSDASDMVRHGIPTAMYGPGDWVSEPNEHMKVQDLIDAANVYARTTSDLVSRPREASKS
jgi:acetylornithine deacetylase/succinyl-diaminopimelate desuccinylase-like protein